MKKRLKRYHSKFYYPPWANLAMSKYLKSIYSNGSIVFSVHAVDKTVECSFQYGKQLFRYLMKSLRKSSLEPGKIFEFYAVGEEIKKACFRLSFELFPVDLILVISDDGTVITIYTTNKGDNHSTLDVKLYEKGV